MTASANEAEQAFDPDAIALPANRALYDYWLSKKRGHELPRRADIDPVDIPRLLPHVMLLDVEERPLRFRFRLVGGSVVAWFGCNATGLYTDSPEYRRGGPDPSPDYRAVVESRQPQVFRKHLAYLLPEYRDFERIVLPLVDEDGCRIERLLCAVDVAPFKASSVEAGG